MNNNLTMNNNLFNTVLSVITLGLVAFNTFGGSNITDAIEKVEAMKVGGEENYAIVKKIYDSPAFKASQKQSLEAAQQQMEGTTPTDTTTTDTTVSGTTDTTVAPTANNTLTDDQIAAIKKMGIWQGDKDAKILFLEYSDLQCPFCKRHHDSATVATLMTKYGDKMAHSFRNFPLSFHQYANAGANATLCAADQSEEKFWKFIDVVFTKTLSSEQILYDAAKEVGLNEAEFKTCMTENKFATQWNAEMSEGQSLFGVSGTPGNVMINTDTKEYVVVAGAYPASEFEKTLDLWTK